MKVIIRKMKNFIGYIKRESKYFGLNAKSFGINIAIIKFIDGIFPPDKRPFYIKCIENYVDSYLKDIVDQYQNEPTYVESNYTNPLVEEDKMPVWCCWWQGEEQMPELVKMCHTRLKQVLPSNSKLYVITLDNYKEYVDIPKHILDKFNNGIITMTTMSDVLRFHLLERYGGYWLDATVFFSDDVPSEYFTREFYCQRMVGNTTYTNREACKGNWCGFSMKGEKGSIIFRFMKDAFSKWWNDYDTIIDYVLIDYMLLTGFKYVNNIHSLISTVENNNEDIFEMYQVLNQSYSKELYDKVTSKNVMHKLTYKIDLYKITNTGELTLYGYLLKKVYGEDYEQHNS